MSETIWKWGRPRDGIPDRQYRVTLKDGTFHWWEEPDDDNRDGGTQAEQSVEDFSQYGPRLIPPDEILDGLCEAIGLADPSWRRPLPERTLALLEAASNGDRGKLDALLHEGANINAMDHQRQTALYCAARRMEKETSRWLLEHGADVHHVYKYGRTILMEAASVCDHARIQLYLQHGADQLARDDKGETAFDLATMAKAALPILQDLYDERLGGIQEAFRQACATSNVELMAWLWSKGPDINAHTGEQGRTPLQACLHDGRFQPEAARWLVEHDADLTVVDAESRRTMLHLAVMQYLPWMVERCSAAGVAVNARDKEEETPLSLAVEEYERPALIKTLLKAGTSAAMLVPAPGGGTETIREKAAREGLVWSGWLLRPETTLPWSGLCCYARVSVSASSFSKDGAPFGPLKTDLWLEFPAEWHLCQRDELSRHLNGAIRSVEAGRSALSEAEGYGKTTFHEIHSVTPLTLAEAKERPWSWPQHALWAVFPDGTVASVPQQRDRRPHTLMGDPRDFAAA